MPPHPSLYKLIVTPVVALLSNLTVLDHLRPNPAEVDNIFDHPLEAFLDPSIMLSYPNLSEPNTENWKYSEELWNHSDSTFIEGFYRNNRLRSTSTPIKGLTTSIMIRTAQEAFGRSPTYQYLADGAISTDRMVELVLKEAEEKSKESQGLNATEASQGGAQRNEKGEGSLDVNRLRAGGVDFGMNVESGRATPVPSALLEESAKATGPPPAGV